MSHACALLRRSLIVTPITFTCCEKHTKKNNNFSGNFARPGQLWLPENSLLLHIYGWSTCSSIKWYLQCQFYNFKSKIPEACQCQLRIDESLMLLLGNIVPHTYNDRTKKIQIYSFLSPPKENFNQLFSNSRAWMFQFHAWLKIHRLYSNLLYCSCYAVHAYRQFSFLYYLFLVRHKNVYKVQT